MKKAFILSAILLISGAAFAEPVVTYSGSTFINCRNIGDTNIFLNDPNDITSVKDGYLVVSSCSDLPRVEDKYLIVENDSVREMTQEEKNAVDLAEQNNELAEFDARVDAGGLTAEELKMVSTTMIIEAQGFTDSQIKTRAKQLKRAGKL